MAYDVSLMKKWDEYSIKTTAFNDGKKEGADEKSRAIALELLKNGLSIDLIVKTTGLSEEIILQLKEEI